MRVFIGSSSERKSLVEFTTSYILDNFGDTIEPVPWTTYWKGGYFLLENLLEFVDSTDAVLLFWSPDDTQWYRGEERAVPRDNLIFEAGLFLAAHGRERTQIFLPDSLEAPGKIGVAGVPSDFNGVTLNYFRWKNEDWTSSGLPNSLRNSLGHLLKLGARPRLPSEFRRAVEIDGAAHTHAVTGRFTKIFNAALPTLASSNIETGIDVMVPYRVGYEFRRNFSNLVSKTSAPINVVFSDMWDDTLCRIYRRKYFDRSKTHIRSAIVTSINELFPSIVAREIDGQLVIESRSSKKASVRIFLTKQRITYSHFRVGNFLFVTPLDIKTNQEPSPTSWLVDRVTSPEVFNAYTQDFGTVLSEAKQAY